MSSPCKIYKLVSKHTDQVYVGSTCLPLKNRMYLHRSSFRAYQKGERGFMTSFILPDLGHVEIVEIDSLSMFDKDELKRRERYWIEKLDTMNKYKPGRSASEWYQDNHERIREYKREWYQDNHKNIRQYDNERVECPTCQKSYSRNNKSHHEKTKFHKLCEC